MLDKVVEKEQLSVNEQELTEHIIRSASRYGMGPDQFAQEIVQAGQVPMLVGEVVRGKALALVLEQAKVVDASGRPVDLEALREQPAEETIGVPVDADEESETVEPERTESHPRERAQSVWSRPQRIAHARTSGRLSTGTHDGVTSSRGTLRHDMNTSPAVAAALQDLVVDGTLTAAPGRAQVAAAADGRSRRAGRGRPAATARSARPAGRDRRLCRRRPAARRRSRCSSPAAGTTSPTPRAW